MNEQWKEVRGFPNYEISNLGVVRNKTTGNPLTIDHNKSNGVGRVFLSKGGRGTKRTRSISTLMNENWKYEWIKELDDDEECKECHGCPGWYITTKGRIFSTHYYRWVKPTKGGSYYWFVKYGSGKKGVSKGFPIHTLVGRTFFTEYQEGLLILHKEEGLPYPQINYLSNLWLGTWSDNNQDTWNKGRNPGKIGWKKVTHLQSSP